MASANTLHRLVDFVVADDIAHFPHHGRCPTREEIEQAWVYAVENEVIVQLAWYLEYSGWHHCLVTSQTDVSALYEAIKNQIYPV